jgi:hypothetical protein
MGEGQATIYSFLDHVMPNEQNALFPPLEGGGDWLRFIPCPFPEQNGVDPWFNRFRGKTADEVRQLLHDDWQQIKNREIRTFAEELGVASK